LIQGDSLEDRDIILKVQAGDREAFALLVEKYHRPLLNFIYRLLGNPSLVEDLGQEIFLNAYLSLGHFNLDRGTPFSAWLFTIARNRVLTELRKKRWFLPLEDFPHLPAKETGAEERLAAQEREAALWECLGVLPEPYRSALMGQLEGLTGVDQSRSQRTPLGTVKARLFRAKRMLRDALEKRLGGG